MTGESPYPPEVAARIADAIEAIERNVADLHDLQDVSAEEYRAADNRLLRDGVERKFEKLTAAIIDVAESILTAAGQAVPETRNDTIAALRRSGIIDERLQAKLHESIGFRDVLAHTYGPILTSSHG